MLHFVHNKRNAYLNHTDTIFHLSNQQKFQTPDYTFCWLDCGEKKKHSITRGSTKLCNSYQRWTTLIPCFTYLISKNSNTWLHILFIRLWKKKKKALSYIARGSTKLCNLHQRWTILIPFFTYPISKNSNIWLHILLVRLWKKKSTLILLEGVQNCAIPIKGELGTI